MPEAQRGIHAVVRHRSDGWWNRTRWLRSATAMLLPAVALALMVAPAAPHAGEAAPVPAANQRPAAASTATPTGRGPAVDPRLGVPGGGVPYAWGSNTAGQLGNGTGAANSSTPVGVAGLTGILAVAGVSSTGIALHADGTVSAWGQNGPGLLGTGSATPATSPVPLTVGQVTTSGPGEFGNVVAISGGETLALALKADGTVWAWGANAAGQIGNNNVPNNAYRATQVFGPGGSGFLTGIVAVAAGGQHGLAVKADGTLYAWGSDSEGQLGLNNTGGQLNYPAQVGAAGLLGNCGTIAAPTCQLAAGAEHSLARKADGTLLAWGRNSEGQLGIGTNTRSTVPVAVKATAAANLTGIARIGVGRRHSLALKNDGTVVAWGQNDYGQLGDGTQGTNRNFPVSVLSVGSGATPLSGITSIAAGELHNLALKADGSVVAWGANNTAQLGNATVPSNAVPGSSNSTRPVDVVTLNSVIQPASLNRSTIAAGVDVSLALGPDLPDTGTGGSATPAGLLVPIRPVRVLDTRADSLIGFDAAGNPLAGAQSFEHRAPGQGDITRRYQVAGKSYTQGGVTTAIPAGIRGLSVNVTLVQPVAGGGFVTVYSADEAVPPIVSTLNPQPGISFNLAYTDVGRVGANANDIAVRSVGDQLRDVIVDVFGYYQ